MLAVTSLAASQFRPADLDVITGSDSTRTDAYRNAVLELQRIRQNTPRVRFAYILRPTDNPDIFAFVADADSLDPAATIDLNSDGQIDDEDTLVWPGDPYDVTEFPEFRDAAFHRPFVDPDLVDDQWGTLLGGTAPIRDDNAPARYVLGLDLDVSDFRHMMNLALLPFVGFIAILTAIITVLSLGLGRMWSRQVRQLADIDRQKDELLSIVSHQLATPITAVRWSLDDLLDGTLGELSPPQRDSLTGISRSMKALVDLTQLLLDVSRIELGRLTMKKEPLDLNAFLCEIVGVAKQMADEKHVTFIPSVPTLPTAFLDSRLTRMVVENLLSNALKYTPTGGTVDLTVERQENQIVIRVSDTGIGISKSDQSKVFAKQYRASNVGAIDGNGFGLYVVKRAVEQQGGRISFSSEAGRGTEFVVHLPL